MKYTKLSCRGYAHVGRYLRKAWMDCNEISKQLFYRKSPTHDPFSGLCQKKTSNYKLQLVKIEVISEIGLDILEREHEPI